MKTRKTITKNAQMMFTVIMVLSLVVFAEPEDSNDICALLEQQFNEKRSGLTVTTVVTVEQLQKSDPNRVLLLLSGYELDSNSGVRQAAYYYEYALARAHPQPTVRRRVSQRFVKTLVDPNVHTMKNQLTKYLLLFEAEDFNASTRKMLHLALLKDNVLKDTILVCGVAGVRDGLDRLEELLIDELKYEESEGSDEYGWYYTKGWYARLARARMGVEEDIEKCIQLVNGVLKPRGYFEDRVGLPSTKLLDDIEYIAQPAAIEYLQGCLRSDKKLLGPQGEPWEPVASYVFDLLAKRLENFPIERRIARFYKQKEIENVREWMAKQEEWKIKR